MAISRQGDSIWAMGAMGYGHQHSPAKDEDHYGISSSSHDYGEALGKKHAGESIDHYHRDAKGRFAPMPHHEAEREHEAGHIKREHRNNFHEGYEKGFHGKIKEHELAEKEKANKTSAVIVRQAVTIDPLTGHLEMEDPGRFHYRMKNKGSDKGYVPPSWLEEMLGAHDAPDGVFEDARHPTDKNPYRHHTDVLKNIANKSKFGLGLGMDDKAPFSRNDVGLAEGHPRLKVNKEYASLRPGEIASRPIQVTDHLGNTHTFVHQVTAPNLNPMDPDNPDRGGKWVVSLHHHISRPDGSADWLPSETSDHVDRAHGVNSKGSDELYKDIWGQLHANSDMVSMYGAGAQRVGDKHNSIEYEFPHPSGQVFYRAKLANGKNDYDGYYYDPDLPERHEEALKGGPQWVVTGHGNEREGSSFDVNSPMRTVQLEGPEFFPKDDIHSVIDRVWSGLNRKDRPVYTTMPQNAVPNLGGRPPEQMIRGASIRPWQPENNIVRSAERLPAW